MVTSDISQFPAPSTCPVEDRFLEPSFTTFGPLGRECPWDLCYHYPPPFPPCTSLDMHCDCFFSLGVQTKHGVPRFFLWHPFFFPQDLFPSWALVVFCFFPYFKYVSLSQANCFFQRDHIECILKEKVSPPLSCSRSGIAMSPHF